MWVPHSFVFRTSWVDKGWIRVSQLLELKCVSQNRTKSAHSTRVLIDILTKIVLNLIPDRYIALIPTKTTEQTIDQIIEIPHPEIIPHREAVKILLVFLITANAVFAVGLTIPLRIRAIVWKIKMGKSFKSRLFSRLVIIAKLTIIKDYFTPAVIVSVKMQITDPAEIIKVVD